MLRKLYYYRRPIAGIVLFLLPALFHLAALWWPNLNPRESADEHGIFVIINLAFAMGFLIPGIAVEMLMACLALLTMQQFFVHGQRFIEAFHEGWFDFQSVSVFIGLLMAWAVLLSDNGEDSQSL